MNAAVRAAMDRMTIPESRYLTPPVLTSYHDLCAKYGEQEKIIRIKTPDGEVPACWFGSPSAEVVLLYLHGGGYTQPAASIQLDFARMLPTNLENSTSDGNEKSFAVLFVAYSLAPEATHPTPLREASAVLLHLVHDAGKSPSNILVGGDSAGGGLVFSLLSHILHPHPQVPEVTLDEPLGGALLLSPWVDFSTEHESFERNAGKDVLVRRCLHVWGSMYTGHAGEDPEVDQGCVKGSDAYVDPASNDAAWWNGLDRVVDDVFIWCGSNEVFVDGVAAFEKVLRKGWTADGGKGERLVYLEAPNESHIQPAIDWKGNDGVKRDSQVAIEAWLKKLISR
jgi:acetyl esterase/lipase